MVVQNFQIVQGDIDRVSCGADAMIGYVFQLVDHLLDLGFVVLLHGLAHSRHIVLQQVPIVFQQRLAALVLFLHQARLQIRRALAALQLGLQIVHQGLEVRLLFLGVIA